MGLNIYVNCPHCGTNIYSNNITHNLGEMAEAAGLYKAVWRPEELVENPTRKDIIQIVRDGTKKLKSNPEQFKKYDAPNGWGVYDNFVEFMQSYLEALESAPDDAEILAWR